eukprot:jgi/Mesvir1/3388/Mv26228-RA.1
MEVGVEEGGKERSDRENRQNISCKRGDPCDVDMQTSPVTAGLRCMNCASDMQQETL